ncbi:MAG TPA: hypothetical protein VJV79_12910 [Polyangiaceae bacterium]|nr:hypothetical protein [Polyangiaceae bacterium]
MRRARLDVEARVRVVSREQLRFSAPLAGVAGTEWLRSGSALVRFGKRLALVQDDALVLGWLDANGELKAESLAADSSNELLFDDKRRKPDFEAAAVLPGSPERLLVFGSGGLPSRERIAMLSANEPTRLVDARALYASLRRERRFAGAELNIEGAFVDGMRLLLCSRGNAARTAESEAFDATVELDVTELGAYLAAPLSVPPPRLGAIERYWLGEIDGVRLTITDAALRGGTAYYLAAAEASADSIADGPVHGASLGVLTARPRYAVIEDERGAPLREKVEGLTPIADSDDWLAIVDADDASIPSSLLRLRCLGL